MVVRPAAPSTAPAAVTAPEADKLADVSDAPVLRPLDPNMAPAAESSPLAVTEDTVAPPVSERPVADKGAALDKPPAAVTAPDVLTLAAVKAPVSTEAELNDPAVTAPLADIVALRIKPVTLIAFAITDPGRLTVRVGSFPMTMDDAVGPRRRTPDVAPVPASRTRSPPTEELCPAP